MTCRGGVGALSFDEEQGVLFDDAKCTRCGQCILSCPIGFRKLPDFVSKMMGCAPCPFSRPLGAMRQVDDTRKVWHALKDLEKYVVVQFAPAVRATLGEEFGIEPGSLVTRRLYAALRRLGCRQVWDTNFSADLTIMEEGNVKVAVAHGLGNARKVCESVRSGGEFAGYHFIEFMACEGGCIGGGGQIIPTNMMTRKARTQGVNFDDRAHAIRKSHQTPEVEQIYQDFLQKPLGHLSHELLHTSYIDRSQQAKSPAAVAK
ncbi:MAG: [Fe-Fe] hydrogenase large subunit C-terminal domain-containing protein [Thermoguttaceae bacterium]|jgi:iron only hydrogenase large subunit-like protein|nr:[Fe-Fe] hydrogenase large subunit C-terminal domain-containing protein [Thermoguttaceae bacterium]MDI9446984.1 [Fe-Fe] hydrogenase large subunit C-terminal domain-containing protein [Planctomycetota bacterium]